MSEQTNDARLSEEDIQVMCALILDAAIAERARHDDAETFQYYAQLIRTLHSMAYAGSDTYSPTIANYTDACLELAKPVSQMQPWLKAQFEATEQQDENVEVIEPDEAIRTLRSPDRAGYVYLLNEINGPHWKIGRTINPDSRLQHFGVKLPYQVEYTCLIKTDNMYALEKNLHNRFADKRIDGEWFALEADDIAYIKSLAVQS